MSCNLEKALAKVNKLLATSVIKTKMFAEIKRIQFEVEAMVAAKKRMLEGPTDETYTTEKVEIDHGTDYTKLITSLENRVKDYVKYVTKDTKNINVHRSTKDANGQTKYLPFGNPFSRYTTGEVDDSILSAMFYRWVVNNEVPASFLSEESTDIRAKRLGGINSARRKIIDELKNIAGKELYYEGTARGKNLSHASTLALIADLYGKGSLTINSNARQNVLTKSTTNKVGQSTENKQTSSIEPKKISRKPEGFKDIGGKEKKPKWLTDTEITFEDIINETEAAIANLPEGYKGAMSGPHVYDGDNNPFWDRDQYLAKYLDKGLEVGDIKDRVIKLVNAGIYSREEEAKVYSKGIEFFEKMVKELKLDEKPEKNVTKFNIQKLIGTLRNSLKTVDEDTEASLYIEAKKYFNKNGFDGTIEEVLKIEPKTHLGLVHFVNLHKAIDPNSEESLKYERLKYEQVLVDLEKKAKKVLAKEDYSDRDKQMIIQSIERDVNDTKNIIKEINSKQNKKIKKDSLTIDVTPIELPYGASNDNNSKTSRPTPEFDTLPEYVPGQKNMIYAGIGSRKTPPEVITQMTEISNYLDGLGYKLQTGKTFNDKEEGADEAFSKGASNKELFGPEQANAQTIKIAKEIHPAPQNLKPGGLKLMARNTYQIFGSNLDTPVDFVLFYAKEGKGIRPDGGTGQAVEMARLKGIPTVNMADNNWRVKLQEVLNNKKLSNKETVKNAEVKPTEDEKIKKPDSRYKTSETELALDEYLSPDLTPEASTKSEDSIISNKAPDTEHKVTIDEIMRCLNLYKG